MQMRLKRLVSRYSVVVARRRRRLGRAEMGVVARFRQEVRISRVWKQVRSPVVSIGGAGKSAGGWRSLLLVILLRGKGKEG